MNTNRGYAIPIAIVVSGLLIAGAVFLNNGDESSSSVTREGSHNTETSNSGAMRSVSAENDHIRGDIDAQITIVEYSDFECPFCGRLHPTLERVVEENPNVRWVYRHFPLSTIHRSAQSAAIASECVAKLGGNEAFWEFSDTLFQNQHALGDSFYRSEAERLGINTDDLNSCMSDTSIAAKVSADLREVQALGGRGTPFAVVIGPSGEMTPVSGALPYESWLSVISSVR